MRALAGKPELEASNLILAEMDRNHYGSIMATITLKNIPPAVHRALEKRARINGRSLNREAILCLESIVAPKPIDRHSLLDKIRQTRATLKGTVDASWLKTAKNLGREASTVPLRVEIGRAHA